MPVGFLMLLIVLVAVAVLLWLGMALLMAYAMLRPPRMTDGKAAYLLRRLSPGDLGLAFEPMSFPVRDPPTGHVLKLAAWWIGHPHADGRCAVLIHGYCDAKIGAIAWAPMFHSLGMNILALDLRAHGESEGTYSTAGFYERDDLNQVLNQLQAQRPLETRQIVLFGISMGSAVAAATAVTREDLAGVILESPFADHHGAALIHAQLQGMPGRLFLRPAQWLAKLLSGADLSQIRPVDLVPRIPCPLMIIHCDQDPFVPEADAASLAAAAQSRPPAVGPTIYWRIAEATHVMGLCANPEEYQRRIGEFLSALPRAPAASLQPQAQ